MAPTRFESFQNSPEPHSIGVEDPGAVAGLEHKWFHAVDSGRRTFQLAKNSDCNSVTIDLVEVPTGSLGRH